MSKTFRLVTTIIIVVLAFFTVLFTGTGLVEMMDGMRSYTVSEDSMIYALQDGRYGDLVSDYHRNMAAEAKSTETMEECYAIARYYEAAIDYKLAVQENDSELSENSEKIMKESAAQMGALSYAEKEINHLLGF